jgi:Spy/CpxP family protein refolding chaperone
MNRKLRQGLVAASAILALAALPALAGPGGKEGRGGRGGFGRLLPPASYLDLTADQEAAVDKLRESTKAKVQPLHEAQRAKRQELKALLDGAKPDPLKVGNLTIEMHENRQQIRSALESARVSFEALLTPEQKTKYENFRELREERRERRHDRRGGPADDDGDGRR